MPSVKKGGLKKTFNFPPLKAGSSPDKVLSGATRTMAGGKAQTPASSSRKRNLNATEASKSKGGNKKPCRTNGDSSGGNQEQATNSLPGSSKQPSQQNNLLGGAVTINAGYERDRMPPGSRTRPRGQRNNPTPTSSTRCRAVLADQIQTNRPSIIFWQEIGPGHRKRGELFPSAADLVDFMEIHIREPHGATYQVLARNMDSFITSPHVQPCISYHRDVWEQDNAIFNINSPPWNQAPHELDGSRFFTALLKEITHSRYLLVVSYHGQYRTCDDVTKRRLVAILVEYVMGQLDNLFTRYEILCSCLIGGDFNISIDTGTLVGLLQERNQSDAGPRNRIESFDVKVSLYVVGFVLSKLFLIYLTDHLPFHSSGTERK
jgi:hypothetical protein